MFLCAVVLESLEEFVIGKPGGTPLFPDEKAVREFFGVPFPLDLRSLALARIVSVIAIFVFPGNPVFWVTLLAGSFLRSLRFLGSLNGGSDSMGMVILLPLAAGSVFGNHPALKLGALYWIGIQGILSYFLSGIHKARNPLWWRGEGLGEFLKTSRVGVRGFMGGALIPTWMLKWISMGVLFFELAFPLALIGPDSAVVFLGMGALFHLGVFMQFGLNRFFWIWISCYPAIYFLAWRLNGGSGQT